MIINGVTLEAEAQFFPVGHGLTYAFKIGSFHVLFDINQQCDLNALASFYGNKEIDIMVLSHFHEDHVSGVKNLYDFGFRTKRIYIPYLDDDEKIYYGLYFWRQGIDFDEFLDSLNRNQIIYVREEATYSYPLGTAAWKFNMYQHRGTSKKAIAKIISEFNKLGIFTYKDISLPSMKDDIKKAYENLKKKNPKLNLTSMFMVHGPENGIVTSSEYEGWEFLSKKREKGNNSKFCSLISGDCSPGKNRAVLMSHEADLGYALVPHHSGVEKREKYLCESKCNRNIIWIVTIAECKARPYGRVVSDIYSNKEKLYICDKKEAFIYKFD